VTRLTTATPSDADPVVAIVPSRYSRDGGAHSHAFWAALSQAHGIDSLPGQDGGSPGELFVEISTKLAGSRQLYDRIPGRQLDRVRTKYRALSALRFKETVHPHQPDARRAERVHLASTGNLGTQQRQPPA